MANLFRPKWVEIYLGKDEDEFIGIKNAFDADGIRYKSGAFTRESRMTGAIIHTQNSRNPGLATTSAYMADPGIQVYRFEVRPVDVLRARRLISSVK